MREHNELVTARVVVTKRISFNFIAAATITVFFCITAFGQSMYATTYSDVWGDTEYVYGCGVTEGYDFGHHARVSTRVTAPNGYYNEYDTGELADTFARADVTFPRYYEGEYLVQSDHWQWCPTAFALEYAGSTLDSLFFGPWSEKWYKTTDVTEFPKEGTCLYKADCAPGTTYPCNHGGGEIVDYCIKKYIKEVIPIRSDGDCGSLVTEFWDTKFGTCGRKP
jgi:hypothetical protein